MRRPLHRELQVIDRVNYPFKRNALLHVLRGSVCRWHTTSNWTRTRGIAEVQLDSKKVAMMMVVVVVPPLLHIERKAVKHLSKGTTVDEPSKEYMWRSASRPVLAKLNDWQAQKPDLTWSVDEKGSDEKATFSSWLTDLRKNCLRFGEYKQYYTVLRYRKRGLAIARVNLPEYPLVEL